uniref:Uncharacterized protein n=1 Tax=Caenorhabditis japonica TaxID=281687 RepID=A0A8R1HXA9_CAEJA
MDEYRCFNKKVTNIIKVNKSLCLPHPILFNVCIMCKTLRCGIQDKFSFLFLLSLFVLLSVFYSIYISYRFDYTISDISEVYLEHARKFKDPYPPVLIGAYEEIIGDSDRISVSVVALKPIG